MRKQRPGASFRCPSVWAARTRHSTYVTLVGVFACSSQLKLAPRGAHPPTYAATPVAVDTEPPPAEVEAVPAAPHPDCAWADGYWRWEAANWNWNAGKWVSVPEGCYYADSFMTWVPSPDGHGTLYYTQGRWYRRSTGDFCPEPAACISPQREG